MIIGFSGKAGSPPTQKSLETVTLIRIFWKTAFHEMMKSFKNLAKTGDLVRSWVPSLGTGAHTFSGGGAPEAALQTGRTVRMPCKIYKSIENITINRICR